MGYDFGSNTYESTNANSLLQLPAGYGGAQRARNLTFLAAYTFSKSMDNASSFSTMNFSNFHLSRSLSAFDATHNFVVSYNYALPFDHALGGAPKRLTQGWSLNGITRFASGFSDLRSRRAATARSPAPARSIIRISSADW